LCDVRIVDLTRRCKPLVFAFYSVVRATTQIYWETGNSTLGTPKSLIWSLPKVADVIMSCIGLSTHIQYLVTIP